MSRVIVVMKPTSGKNALSDVIMGVSIVNRDGGGADGGGEGKEDDESTSEGGQHDASRGSARKGAMKGEDDLLSVGYKTSVSCNFRNRTYRSQSGTPHFIFPFPSRVRLALARRHPPSRCCNQSHNTRTFRLKRFNKNHGVLLHNFKY